MTPTPYRGTLPFPLTMTMPDGTTVHPVRAVASQAGLRVYDWDYQAHEGVVVFEAPQVLRVDHGTFVVDLGDEGTVTLSEGPGCGCSHPLKRWRPSGPVRV